MKMLRAIPFALALIALASSAQAQQTNVVVNVPFNFYAGDVEYPAGQYFLRSATSNDALIRLDDWTEAHGRHLLSNTCENPLGAKETKLVFRRAGESYFLYQVWVEGHTDGRQFPVSRTEKLLAMNHDKPETVIVAANIAR